VRAGEEVPIKIYEGRQRETSGLAGFRLRLKKKLRKGWTIRGEKTLRISAWGGERKVKRDQDQYVA